MGFESRMLVLPQARSDTIKIAHIKGLGDMPALSTSFKLMLRIGCPVLTGVTKSQGIRPPTDNLVLPIRQCYCVLHDPSAHWIF